MGKSRASKGAGNRVAIPKLSPERLRAVAYHEAGHVAAAVFQMEDFREVSIKAQEGQWGVAKTEVNFPIALLESFPRDLARARGIGFMIGLLSGYVAQWKHERGGGAMDELLLYLDETLADDLWESDGFLDAVKNGEDMGAGSDFTNAARILKTLSSHRIPHKRTYQTAVRWARELLDIPQVWAFVEYLAGRLLEDETVRAEDVGFDDAEEAMPRACQSSKWTRRLYAPIANKRKSPHAGIRPTPRKRA